MRFPTRLLERKLFRDGYTSVIGIDEVGMGCLAGPVVVCAVSFSKEFYASKRSSLDGVRDSKLLTARQRETLASQLIASPELQYTISYCYPKTIDKINIYQAARKAMRRAVAKLYSHKAIQAIQLYSSTALPPRAIVLVDGPHKIQGLEMPQRAIVNGDRTVFAIACASIIAKVHRDRMMARYAKRFPQYGFERHKGYGTKFHVAMLVRFGPTEIHRRSFAPVGNLV